MWGLNLRLFRPWEIKAKKLSKEEKVLKLRAFVKEIQNNVKNGIS